MAEDDDKQKVVKEAEWIKNQAESIEEVIKNSFEKRVVRDEYANLMRKKMIGYAIVGILVVIVISISFYVSLRKIFKDRKIM